MAQLTGEIAVPVRPRILVVDDDVAIGGTIKRYLRNYEYDIEVADCVESAEEQLEQHSFDLMLLDRRLPDGLGDHVIESVRKRGSSLPIILMSGEVEVAARDDRSQHRADDFIEKPFVREALVAMIERLLAAHAVRRQARRQRAELAELHERREREFEVARTIFDRIFARGQFDPASVRHRVIAADRLAGDFVFGAELADGRYRWMIGDITGHTLSSALITILLADAFYRLAEGDLAMADVLKRFERKIASMLPANMFCAGAVCELDRRAGLLQIWNGGNPDILIRHAAGGVSRIASTGAPLGADRFSPPSHSIAAHRVAPGDRIIAFSDGLVEVRERRGEPIGFDQLLSVVETGEPDAIFQRLLDCVPQSAGNLGYDDDISLVEVVV